MNLLYLYMCRDSVSHPPLVPHQAFLKGRRSTQHLSRAELWRDAANQKPPLSTTVQRCEVATGKRVGSPRAFKSITRCTSTSPQDNPGTEGRMDVLRHSDVDTRIHF